MKMTPSNPDSYLTLTKIGFFLLLTIEVTDSVQFIRCHNRAFYNPVLRSCQICRKCPKDEIIQEPCSTLSDTKCGPFNVFNKTDFEHLQRQVNTPDGATNVLVPGMPEGGVDGATTDYKQVHWKNVTLISVGFVMSFTALVSIIVIMVRIFSNRKQYRALQYMTEAPNLVIVKVVDGVEQRSIIAQVTPLVKPREQSNPLYDMTNSDGSMTSQRPLFPNRQHHCDTDSGLGQ